MQCTVIVLVTHRENNDKYAKQKMIHTRRSKMIEMRYSSERYVNKNHFLLNHKLRPPAHQTNEDENNR